MNCFQSRGPFINFIYNKRNRSYRNNYQDINNTSLIRKLHDRILLVPVGPESVENEEKSEFQLE